MYCSNCGAEIGDDDAFCPKCGASQNGQPAPRRTNLDPYDSGSAGWGILGFFFPTVGLILWLVWMNTKPKSARMAGIGALAGVIFTIVLVVLIFALAISLNVTEQLVA